MRFRYALLCDASNETNDGKLNLFGVTEALYAYQFPASHREMNLICSFELEPEDTGVSRTVSVKFIDADAKPLIAMETQVQNPSGRRVLNHRHIFHDTILPAAGLYQFSISVDGVEVGFVPLEVVLIPPPTPA